MYWVSPDHLWAQWLTGRKESQNLVYCYIHDHDLLQRKYKQQNQQKKDSWGEISSKLPIVLSARSQRTCLISWSIELWHVWNVYQGSSLETNCPGFYRGLASGTACLECTKIQNSPKKIWCSVQTIFFVQFRPSEILLSVRKRGNTPLIQVLRHQPRETL